MSVVFTKKKSNTKISVCGIVEGNVVTKNFGCYTTIDVTFFNNIIERLFNDGICFSEQITKAMDVLEKNEITESLDKESNIPQKVYKINFTQTVDNKKIKYVKEVAIRESVSEALKMLRKEVYCCPESYDLKNNRYTIKVFNYEGQNYDSKTISFHTKKCFEDIFVILKDHFTKIQDDKEDDIFFEGENRKNASHYVSLTNGTKSKSFSINLRNYTSREVLEML